ncbi:MAG: ATP synthase F1 subunit epsilon [bacterium]|nr:ATP synthase F1 subunit epsilon [bacterium]
MAMDSTFNCTVITPERQVLDTQATFLAFPAHDGEIGVLRNRAPLLCKLGIGVMRLEASPQNQRIFIDGGFAQVLDNQVTILTEQALGADEIDVDEARAALDEAKARPGGSQDDIAARQREIARQSAKLRTAQSAG